jgi:prepilin-type processing-associated H-X9-DG protein
VKDGLSNTIMFAECAGRPSVYRNNREIGSGVTSNRINGGGWARPASDFFIDGAKITNPQTLVASIPGGSPSGLAGINVTNGEDIGGQTFTTATGYPKANTNTNNPITATPLASTAYYNEPDATGFYGTGEIYAFHPQGANIAFGDGSVRFVNEQIDIVNLARLATRSAGEIVEPGAFDQ